MSRDHLKKLTLARLGMLGGGEAEDVLDAALFAAVRDLERRPGLKAARKINLSIGLKPMRGGNVKVTFSAKASLPEKAPETIATAALGEKDASLLFNPLSGTHLDQLPIPFEPPPAAPDVAASAAASFKLQHPDKIIAVHLGDQVHLPHPADQVAVNSTGVPTSFPFGDLSRHLKALLGAGHRVAVCEQQGETPKPAAGPEPKPARRRKAV